MKSKKKKLREEISAVKNFRTQSMSVSDNVTVR